LGAVLVVLVGLIAWGLDEGQDRDLQHYFHHHSLEAEDHPQSYSSWEFSIMEQSPGRNLLYLHTCCYCYYQILP
jgi:hypothetical protein